MYKNTSEPKEMVFTDEDHLFGVDNSKYDSWVDLSYFIDLLIF